MTENLLVLWLVLLSLSCTAPDRQDLDLQTMNSAVIAGSRSSPSIISAPEQRDRAHRLAGDVLSDARLSDGRFLLGTEGRRAQQTPEGRELLTLLIACALPPGLTVASSGESGAVEFFGEAGLAPRWLHHALDLDGRRWVSACAMARLGLSALAIPVSLRGRDARLVVDPDEASAFPLEEGAFFGDIFVDPVKALPWFACQGDGPRDETILADRACTEEDPDRLGVTRCGMVFLGVCSTSCRRVGGLYGDCHAWGRAVSGRQVITTFLSP